MSWDRLEHARRLASEPAETIVRHLAESECGGDLAEAFDAARIARLVDEVAARLDDGGALHLAAAGPVAHLVRFAAEEAAAWFPGTIPLDVVTPAGSEDEEEAVAATNAHVRPADVVVAVSRSGARAWTCTVARRSNMIGALTASISTVPASPLSRESDLPLVVPAGGEVVMGCTAYRAATAVKIVIDSVLLALAARRGGLAGDVPVRARLGADAWRLVAAAAEIDHLRARSLLAATEGDVPAAVVMAKLGVDADEARRRLAAAGGRLDLLLGGS